MDGLARDIRCICLRSLYIALFPFVFLWSAYESTPREWRHGVGNALGAVLLFGLGLTCVNAIAFGL